MEQVIFDFIISIPETVAKFATWLLEPISPQLDIAPITLLGIGGTTILISIIVVHVVKLFI